MVVETYKTDSQKITVSELYNILLKLIEDSRGDFQIRLECGINSTNCKEIQVNVKANGENEIILL
jgi:hypothetical protein